MLSLFARKAFKADKWSTQLFIGTMGHRFWRDKESRPKTSEHRQRATIYDLPREVMDQIIAYLRGNDSALRACSLTCQAWVWQAQKELHRSIYFDYGRNVTRSPKRYSSPNIAQNVHTLDVLLLPPPPVADEDWRSDDADVLWQIFRRLTHLRQLAITDTQWFCSAGRRAVLASAFAHVVSLRLADVRFAHAADFLCFLSAFEWLEELRLDGVRWEDLADPANAWILEVYPEQDIERVRLPGRALRRIAFGCWYGEVDARVARDMVQHWLSRVAWPQLEVEWRMREDVGALPDVLKAVGPSVTHLELGRRRGRPLPDSKRDDFGIRHCTKLNTLVIRGSCSPACNPYEEDFADGVFSWVPWVLRNVTSYQLRYIAFSCVIGNRWEFQRLKYNLQVIDDILGSPVFHNLEEISFSFETLSADYIPCVVDMVLTNMPHAAERNLLSLYDQWYQQ